MDTKNLYCHFRAILGAVVAVFASPSGHANSYTIVDLGLGRVPVQINNRGEIAGQYSHRDSTKDALVFRGDRWHKLSSPGGYAAALAINSVGDVVGVGESGLMPTIWRRVESGQPIALPPGGEFGTPFGIASDGTVVGRYRANDRKTRCFRTSAEGVSIDLGMPRHGDYCHATAINKQGWIAGIANEERGGDFRSFLWKEGVFHYLGALSAEDPYAFAEDVNNFGHVVGCAHVEESAHAFLWDGKSMVDIGVSDAYRLTTCARSINENGQIVGTGSDDLFVQHAVRFENGAVITLADEVVDLGDWTLHSAESINNQGVIVGFGTLAGKTHGFKLVPLIAR